MVTVLEGGNIKMLMSFGQDLSRHHARMKIKEGAHPYGGRDKFMMGNLTFLVINSMPLMLEWLSPDIIKLGVRIHNMK